MANNLRSFLWARLHRGTNATQNIWATCIHLSIWFQSGMSMRFWLVRAFNYMETALFEYTTIRVWFKMHRESATEFYICRCAQSVCVSCVITFSLSNDIFSWSRARIQACYNYKHKYCFDFNQWHCLVNLSLDLFRFYFIVYCVRRSLIWHCLTNKRNFEKHTRPRLNKTTVTMANIVFPPIWSIRYWAYCTHRFNCHVLSLSIRSRPTQSTRSLIDLHESIHKQFWNLFEFVYRVLLWRGNRIFRICW